MRIPSEMSEKPQQDASIAGHPRAWAGSRAPLSRRAFLGGAALVPAAPRVKAAEPGPVEAAGQGQQRAAKVFQIRTEAARLERLLPLVDHVSNGDEQRYLNRIGNYSKGLPHNNLGEVDPNAYNALLDALSSARTEDFEKLVMGCPDPARQRKLVNPQAGVAFDLEGADSHHLAIPPGPLFSSADQAGEIVELYWMALLRDVPFTEYGTNALAQAAAVDLSRLSDFRGPKSGGQVTAATLFRGFTPGDLAGPYISQFLLRPVPFGAQPIDSRMRTLMPGIDYMVQYPEWLEIQNGWQPAAAEQFDPVRRYIRNGRDLAQWVHIDVLFQAYFNAMLILLTPPDGSDQITGGGIGAPLNPGNPYNNLRNLTGFGTFGGPHIATMVAEVSTRALKAQWCQKWYVHRRLRPEAFGGRVHNRLANGANYPIHRDALNSAALGQVFSRSGTYLLPQVYPEGSPLHPSYGAGHATVAGACVTILKALLDESFEVPNPVVPAPDGQSLVPYVGGPLTVGGELNKLAANVAMGRNVAGIHWRTDYTESLKLGEAVAISVLRDQRLTYTEDFQGFTFRKFDGTGITV